MSDIYILPFGMVLIWGRKTRVSFSHLNFHPVSEPPHKPVSGLETDAMPFVKCSRENSLRFGLQKMVLVKFTWRTRIMQLPQKRRVPQVLRTPHSAGCNLVVNDNRVKEGPDSAGRRGRKKMHSCIRYLFTDCPVLNHASRRKR